MAPEKRLIDANSIQYHKTTECHGHGLFFTEQIAYKEEIERIPAVDAVEVDEYIELREQYDRLFTEFHELRDAFVDYVCSGIPNPSPFCKNKRHGCCDSYGWCKHDDQCTGFNPVEWFSDGERKDK